jgi:uncharacterized membrane protein YphA (DoxX/SURF4 family)
VLFKSIYPSAINPVLLIVRLYLGPMIFTHGYRKIFRGGTLAGTTGWFDSIGMKPGRLNALAAASTELSVGALLVFGLVTLLACAGLLALMLVACHRAPQERFYDHQPGRGNRVLPRTYGDGPGAGNLRRGQVFTGLLVEHLFTMNPCHRPHGDVLRRRRRSVGPAAGLLLTVIRRAGSHSSAVLLNLTKLVMNWST